MNSLVSRVPAKTESVHAGPFASFQAECTPHGLDGMKSARLCDAAGADLGRFFYSIAEEKLGVLRIIYVELHHVQTTWGRSDSGVEELASERVRDIVMHRVGKGHTGFTYLSRGVRPDDPEQFRLWRKIGIQLSSLITPRSRVRALEESRGCRKHALEIAECLRC